MNFLTTLIRLCVEIMSWEQGFHKFSSSGTKCCSSLAATNRSLIILSE